MALHVLLPFVLASLIYPISSLEEPMKCIIIQDKQGLKLPSVPKFLTENKDICRHRSADWQGQDSLQCGTSDVYIKPECVCTFHNVWEAMYHHHTACSSNENSDSVLTLKCSDCEKYSLNKMGPCINGGILNCTKDALAPDIQCDCPRGYSGMFCEEEMQKVTRICDRILNKNGLPSCDKTKMDCVTYSEKKRYMFKCYDGVSIKEEGDLPLCNKAESFVAARHSSKESTTSVPREDDRTLRKDYLTSGAAKFRLSLLMLIISITSLFNK